MPFNAQPLARPLSVVGRCKALCFAVFFVLSGCSVVHQKALEPLGWVGSDVERYAVSGAGSWARLRKQPIDIGPFRGDLAAQSLWNSLPSTSTSDVQVAIGSDDSRGHQLHHGTVIQSNESELQVRLTGSDGVLADLRCRQRLYSESQETGVSRGDGTNTFSMSENVAYSASLNCMAKGVSELWPQWQLDLHNEEPVPMRGTLRIQGTDFQVVGSQSSNIGASPTTVSYEIRRGDTTLALIDRSGDGLVSLVRPVGEQQHIAFVGAAMVLLLANDPLEL